MPISRSPEAIVSAASHRFNLNCTFAHGPQDLHGGGGAAGAPQPQQG